MKEKSTDRLLGVVHAESGLQRFSLVRYEPADALQPFIEHYWIVRYDLRGQAPYTQTVLSHPSVNLAFEHDPDGRRALVYGIPRRPFQRTLQDAGHVLGIKFLPGGFYPFHQQPVSALFGQTLEAASLFDQDWATRSAQVLDARSDRAMAEQAEQWLLQRLPAVDAQAREAGEIVRTLREDQQFVSVEQVCTRFHLSMRQLQRTFSKYIGVSPKWVLKRYRLQEAAELLAHNPDMRLADLAIQLHYYDQAHFIRDFTTHLGQSPSRYRQQMPHREDASPNESH